MKEIVRGIYLLPMPLPDQFTGHVNTYLIQGDDQCILIDTGSINQQQTFIHHLAKHGISAGQIGLVVITHAHFDHVGSLKAIKALCQCPVAIHEEESPLLRKGLMVVPPGTSLFGKVASFVGKMFMRPLLRFPPVEPDILISEDYSLESFGIPGKILPTQGHTEGSLSVLLESGEAFVGDLAANYLPFGLGPILPPFARPRSRRRRHFRPATRLPVAGPSRPIPQ